MPPAMQRPQAMTLLSRSRVSVVGRPWRSGPASGRGAGVSLATSAAGFSLLEVLVAFVILLLVGTALFRLFSGALGNAGLSDEYSRATLYAESQLARASVERPLREGVQQGTSDDGYYAWTVKIERYTPPGTPEMDSTVLAMGVNLWRLAATVRWPGAPGSERSVALTTLTVAIKEPTA
jgi:general secretion pathway protein I